MSSGMTLVQVCDSKQETTECKSLACMDLFAMWEHEIVTFTSGTLVSVAQQIERAKGFFPELGMSRIELVSTAEGISPRSTKEDYDSWCIPSWESFAPSYNDAVAMVFARLSETRKGMFYDFTGGRIGAKYLQQTSHKVQVMNKLPRGIMIVAIEFVAPRNADSVRRVRTIIGGVECYLGVYEIAMMLLLAPERFVERPNCWVNLLGDTWQAQEGEIASGDVSSLHFWFNQGKIGLGFHSAELLKEAANSDSYDVSYAQ